MDHSKPTGYDASSPGGLNSRLIILLFAIGGVLLVVILASVEAWFYNQERAIEEEGYRRGNPELQAYNEAQDRRLSQVHRIEGDDKHVTVPLDFVIDELVTENEKGESAK